MEQSILIPGPLESAALDGIVAKAGSIYDQSLDKTQAVINHEHAQAIQELAQQVAAAAAMPVVERSTSSTDVTAQHDVVYIWSGAMNAMTIRLRPAADSTRVAVYSFFVPTGGNPDISIVSESAGYTVVLPSDYAQLPNTWCEIEAMQVGNRFFVRIINY